MKAAKIVASIITVILGCLSLMGLYALAVDPMSAYASDAQILAVLVGLTLVAGILWVLAAQASRKSP